MCFFSLKHSSGTTNILLKPFKEKKVLQIYRSSIEFIFFSFISNVDLDSLFIAFL